MPRDHLVVEHSQRFAEIVIDALIWSSHPRLASAACPDDARDSVEPPRSTVEPPRSTVEPSRSTVSGLVTAGDLHQGWDGR